MKHIRQRHVLAHFLQHAEWASWQSERTAPLPAPICWLTSGKSSRSKRRIFPLDPLRRIAQLFSRFGGLMQCLALRTLLPASIPPPGGRAGRRPGYVPRPRGLPAHPARKTPNARCKQWSRHDIAKMKEDVPPALPALCLRWRFMRATYTVACCKILWSTGVVLAHVARLIAVALAHALCRLGGIPRPFAP